MLVILLVVMLFALLFILSPQYVPLKDIHFPHDMSGKSGLPGAIPLAGRSFLVPLSTGQGLQGKVTIDGRGIANNPLLPVGNFHDAMTCAVGHLCPHWHCAKVDRLSGFLLASCLPFFVVGAVDNVGIAVDALLDTAAGATRAGAFFLFFFDLAVAEGTMGGRAGGTMMILFHSSWCGCPGLFSRRCGQSCSPCSLG
jgi:hypothetical protein